MSDFESLALPNRKQTQLRSSVGKLAALMVVGSLLSTSVIVAQQEEDGPASEIPEPTPEEPVEAEEPEVAEESENSEQKDKEPEAVPNKSEPSASKESAKSEDSSEDSDADQSPDVFDPSEEISEDFAVPFPVDI